MSCFVWCLHRHHHNQGYDDDFVETHGMSERSVLTGNVRELSQNFCIPMPFAFVIDNKCNDWINKLPHT